MRLPRPTPRIQRLTRSAVTGTAMIALAVVLAACGGSSDQVAAGISNPTTTPTAQTAPESVPEVTPYPSAPAGRPATTTVVHRPPYVERVAWTDTEVGPSLSVFPTTSGRYTDEVGAQTVAWAEVLALDPGADTPGMQAQFDCHWRYARLVEPEKPSWNLEPGRPVVTDEDMVGSRCNPGFAEEY
ncbi:DUF2599 domain-containing protein [Gordonia jinghuaiqii]|nr:DUF2599 domain-containing protein [Gordonia jinghuaiqii]